MSKYEVYTISGKIEILATQMHEIANFMMFEKNGLTVAMFYKDKVCGWVYRGETDETD